MRDFAFHFEDGGIAVDWSAEVGGIHNVKQKLINNLMTDVGTDDIVPARGTSLMRDVAGGTIYDLRSAQHALNFASLDAKRAVRDGEPEDVADSDRVVSFAAVLDSIEGRDLVTQLALTTADGHAIGARQQLT